MRIASVAMSYALIALTLLVPLVAPPLRAEISIDDSAFSVDVFAGVDENGDDIILDDEADLDEVTRNGALSFSADLAGRTRASSGSARQNTRIALQPTSLVVDSTGSCAGTSTQGGDSTQGYGNSGFNLTFSLTVPTRMSVTGPIAASENARTALGIPPATGLEVTDRDQNVAESVLLDPGTYAFGIFCSADSYFDRGFDGHRTASASWSIGLRLTEGEEECGAEPLTWVGGRAGAFAEAENWSPPIVPIFEEEGRCDTAVIRGGRDVVLDLDAAAAITAAATAPEPIRRVNRLVIDQSRDLRPIDGTIRADELSALPGQRSLELINGASLLLNGGAVLARHVAVGRSGPGEILVAGTQGLLETEGRLGLGLAGDGSLIVEDGGTVIAAELVVGEADAVGSVQVLGAASTLDTGSIAVGLESEGFLFVEGGGRVTSEAAVIGFNLEGDDRSLAEVRGSDANANRSSWIVDSLDVRPRGSLEIEDGGRVEVLGTLSIGAEGAPAACVHQAACVSIADGHLSANDVVVGAGGGAELRIGPKGSLASSGTFTIDSRAEINGPSENDSVFTDLVIAPDGDSVGQLRLSGRTQLDLLGRFRVGPSGDALGIFFMQGDGEDPTATRVSAIDATGLDSVIGVASENASDLPVTGWMTLENARLELSGPGHDLVVEWGGRLDSRGGQIAIEADSKLVNRGLIQGDLVLEGDYVQEATGRLAGTAIFVPAPEPARSASRATAATAAAARAARPEPPKPIVVTGNATLAGSAKLQFGNGFAPKQGDRFELLQVQGEVTGGFDELEIAGLVPGSFDLETALVDGALVLTSQTNAEPLPAVTLTGKTKLRESSKRGTIKLARKGGDASTPLTVTYTVGGTAENGVDFVALPGSVEIPAGKKSVTLSVVPIADSLAESGETIEIALTPNTAFAPGLASELSIEMLDGKKKKKNR